jgi:predicted DNA-binding antitoxin AbrB/MazE fold protein
MDESIDAVYEGGVLRPLVPLALRESEHVHVTVRSSNEDWLDADSLELALRDGDPSIPLSLVREQLSRIAGTLADAVITDRGEY